MPNFFLQKSLHPNPDYERPTGFGSSLPPPVPGTDRTTPMIPWGILYLISINWPDLQFTPFPPSQPTLFLIHYGVGTFEPRHFSGPLPTCGLGPQVPAHKRPTYLQGRARGRSDDGHRACLHGISFLKSDCLTILALSPPLFTFSFCWAGTYLLFSSKDKTSNSKICSQCFFLQKLKGK